MTYTSAQQPDGSWQPAEPIGWQPGVDWEVRRLDDGRRLAEAFVGPERVAVVAGRYTLGVRMWLTARRLRRQGRG